MVAAAGAKAKHLAAEVHLQIIGKRVGGGGAKVVGIGLAISHGRKAHRKQRRYGVTYLRKGRVLRKRKILNVKRAVVVAKKVYVAAIGGKAVIEHLPL